MILASSLVAVLAIIFGSIVGGTVGLFSRLLLGIPYRIKLFGIMELIITILIVFIAIKWSKEVK